MQQESQGLVGVEAWNTINLRMFAFCDILSHHVTPWSHAPSLTMPLLVTPFGISYKIDLVAKDFTIFPLE